MLEGIKIVSDGSVQGTRVYSSDGEDLTSKLKICDIKWRHTVSEIPTAELTCILAGVEVEVPGENMTLQEITHLGSYARDWKLGLARKVGA